MPLAPMAKKKTMGMGSIRPQMQGPISGGAGGGLAPAQNYASQMRPTMPLPPSAAQRPGMPNRGGGFMPPGIVGGGFMRRPQPPAGGAPMMPPLTSGGMDFAPRGIPGGEGMGGGFPQRMQVMQAGGAFDKPQMPGAVPVGPDPRAAMMERMNQFRSNMPNKQAMMASIGQPPVANSPAPGIPPGKSMPDFGALRQMLQQRRMAPQF